MDKLKWSTATGYLSSRPFAIASMYRVRPLDLHGRNAIGSTIFVQKHYFYYCFYERAQNWEARVQPVDSEISHLTFCRGVFALRTSLISVCVFPFELKCHLSDWFNLVNSIELWHEHDSCYESSSWVTTFPAMLIKKPNSSINCVGRWRHRARADNKKGKT